MYVTTWNTEKARENLDKHDVRFSDAEVALYDPGAIAIEDETSEGERRYVSIGTDAVGRIPVLGAKGHAHGKNEL